MQSRVLLSHVHLISSEYGRGECYIWSQHTGQSHRGQPSNLQSWQPIYDMAVCQNFSWLERKSAANKYQEGLCLVAVCWRMKNIPSDKWRADNAKTQRLHLVSVLEVTPKNPFIENWRGSGWNSYKDNKLKKAKETKTTKPLYVSKVL